MVKRADKIRQDRFVNEFLVDLNATQAAGRAGYSTNNYGGLKSQGCRLLAMPHIQAKIARAQAARLKRISVTQDDVVEELKHICFADPAEMFDEYGALIPPTKWPESLRRAIQAVEVYEFDANGVPTNFRVRFWDKNKALTQMGLHLGMYSDKDAAKKGAPAQLDKRWTVEFVEPLAKRTALPAPEPARPPGGRVNGH